MKFYFEEKDKELMAKTIQERTLHTLEDLFNDEYEYKIFDEILTPEFTKEMGEIINSAIKEQVILISKDKKIMQKLAADMMYRRFKLTDEDYCNPEDSPFNR